MILVQPLDPVTRDLDCCADVVVAAGDDDSVAEAAPPGHLRRLWRGRLLASAAGRWACPLLTHYCLACSRGLAWGCVMMCRVDCCCFGCCLCEALLLLVG